MLTIDLPVYDEKDRPYCASISQPNGGRYSVRRFFINGYLHYEKQPNGRNLAFRRYRLSPYMTYELCYQNGQGRKSRCYAVRIDNSGEGLLALNHAATLKEFNQMGIAKKWDPVKPRTNPSPSSRKPVIDKRVQLDTKSLKSMVNKRAYKLSGGNNQRWQEIREELWATVCSPEYAVNPDALASLLGVSTPMMNMCCGDVREDDPDDPETVDTASFSVHAQEAV